MTTIADPVMLTVQSLIAAGCLAGLVTAAHYRLPTGATACLLTGALAVTYLLTRDHGPAIACGQLAVSAGYYLAVAAGSLRRRLFRWGTRSDFARCQESYNKGKVPSKRRTAGES